MNYREQIARDKGFDNTLSLLLDGYLYISNRTKKYDRKMFETRLLGGKKVICMVGKEAAEVFYDQEKFKRHGAAPQRVVKTLFGQKGVQTLDGAAHRRRKELFISLMTEERLHDLRGIFKQEWMKAFAEKRDRIVLYDEAKKTLMRTACTWAGLPNFDEKLTDHLASMFEAGGAIGMRHWYGRYSRHQIEGWLRYLIQAVRNDFVDVAEKTALHKIAFFRDTDGELLDLEVAAVELINILRPIVAIAVYITFCALALHLFPSAREKLQAGTQKDYQMFLQEVRRYYPFFPMVIAKVRTDFFWHGYGFKKDTLVMLDLYGTNHDPDLWENPDEFDPERFQNWQGNPFSLIPQGGANHGEHHRCAGEWLTIDVLEVCLQVLISDMEYDVPAQNLLLSKRKMPCTPQSGFVMENVRLLNNFRENAIH